jgi:hypothetical protein
MSVQQDLLDLGDLFSFCDLSTFTHNIPIDGSSPRWFCPARPSSADVACLLTKCFGWCSAWRCFRTSLLTSY